MNYIDDQAEKLLKGKVLTGLQIAEDSEALRFVLGEDEVVVRVDAECCSYTWIESIELPALGFPATVLSVEDLDMPEPSDEEAKDYECLAKYGCKITTDKGEIVIDYRNDSNGYYGGDLSWPGDSFYGGVFDQNKSKQVWKDVT